MVMAYSFLSIFPPALDRFYVLTGEWLSGP
jgi:hypothetical protein